MALPDYTAQDATTYKTNIDTTASDHENRITANEAYLSGATAGTVLTTGDEGSGGGINADSVDGKELTEIYELADSDAPAAATSFLATSNLTEFSWESVGPTDSGADNIWTALDSVPPEAAWVEVKVISSVANESGGTCSLLVYARKTGSLVSATNQARIDSAFVRADGATGVAGASVSVARIPTDSNGRFDLFYHLSIGESPVVNVYLVGWGY